MTLLPTLVDVSGMTIEDVAAQCYRLVRPDTNDVDPSLQAQVISRLLQANGIASATTKIPTGTIVELPPHGGAPYVFYSSGALTQTTVDSLASAGFRSLSSVRSLDNASQLPLSSSEQADLVWSIADLAQVPEIGVALALSLISDGYDTALSLREVLLSSLEGALSGVATPEQLTSSPSLAATLSIRSQDLYPETHTNWRMALGVPVDAARLRELAGTWWAKSQQPGTLKATNSARSIAHLYQSGASIMEAHRAIRLRDTVAAKRAYKSLFKRLASAGEANELSLQDVLDKSLEWLSTMSLADADQAVRGAGLLPTEGRWRSVDSARAAELAEFDPASPSVPSPFSSNVIERFGRPVAEAVLAYYANHNTPVSATIPDTESENNQYWELSIRVPNLLDGQREELLSRLQAITLDTLFGHNHSAYLAAMAAVPAEVQFPIPSMTGPLSDPSILPSALQGRFQANDRLSVVEREGQTLAVTVREYQARYKDDVFGPVYASEHNGLILHREDFLDPARLCLLLPTLFLRNFVLGASELARLGGESDKAMRIAKAAATPSDVWTSAFMSRRASDWLSIGTSVTGYPDRVQATLGAQTALRAGNIAYQSGNLQTALQKYEECRSVVWRAATTPEIVDSAVDARLDVVITAGLADRNELLRLGEMVMEVDGFATRPYKTFTRSYASSRSIEATYSNSTMMTFQDTTYMGVLQAADNATQHGGDPLLAASAEALVRVRQIEAGLNWLGLDNATIPTWSFDALLGQARQLAQVADGWQQRALRMLEQADDAGIAMLRATNEEVLAGKRLAVAEAASQVAEAQKRQANQSLDHFQQQRWSAYLNVAVSGLNQGIGVANDWDGDKPAQNWSGVGLAGASVVNQLVTLAYELPAARSALEAELSVADIRITAAVATEEFAEESLGSATAMLEALQARELNKDAYDAMLLELELLSESMLRTATQLAWLAERAHTYQYRSNASVIRMAYYDDKTIAGRFSSAAMLQADIEALASHRFLRTRQPLQVIKTTISLGESYPTALFALREAGDAFLNLSLDDLDQRFPGLYLHRLRHVELALDGVVAGDTTVLLHSSPVSPVRVPNTREYVTANVVPDAAYGGNPDAPYVRAMVSSRVHTEVFSAYDRRVDAAVLTQEGGELSGLANASPSGLWRIELPLSGVNGVDRQAITDVRLTLYFTAEHDPALAAAQAAVRQAGQVLPSASLMLGRRDAASSRVEFLQGSLESSYDDVRYFVVDVTNEQLHPHRVQRQLSNLEVVLGGADTPTELRVAHSLDPFGALVGTNATGEVYSMHGEGSSFSDGTENWTTTRQGSAVLEDLVDRIRPRHPNSAAGRWVVKVSPSSANSAWYARDEDGGLVTETSGGLLFPEEPSSATRTVDPLANVEAVAMVGGLSLSGASKFGLELRSGSPGATTIELENSAGTMWLRVSDSTGLLAVISADTNALDDIYELRCRLHGHTATVLVDRVEVARVHVAATDAGAVKVFGDKGAFLSSIRLERLRADGRSLGTSLSETFPNGSPGEFVLDNAVHVNRSRARLDLQRLDEVALLLSFDGREAVEPALDVFEQSVALNGHQHRGPNLFVNENGTFMILAELDDITGTKLLARSGAGTPRVFELLFQGGALEFKFGAATGEKTLSLPPPTDPTQSTLYYIRWSAVGTELGWRQGRVGRSTFMEDRHVGGSAGNTEALAFRIFDNGSSNQLQLTGRKSYLMLDRRASNMDIEQVVEDNSFVSFHYDPPVTLHPVVDRSHAGVVEDGDVVSLVGGGSEFSLEDEQEGQAPLTVIRRR